MTLFVDSSAWFAAVYARDTYHEPAKRILREQQGLITSDHILVETWLLLKNRFN